MSRDINVKNALIINELFVSDFYFKSSYIDAFTWANSRRLLIFFDNTAKISHRSINNNHSVNFSYLLAPWKKEIGGFQFLFTPRNINSD